MESQGPQGSQDDCSTPLTQPVVVSQNQGRMTDFFPQIKPRKKRKVQKSSIGSELGKKKETDVECIVKDKTPEFDQNEQSKELALPTAVNEDDLFEKELLGLDLDANFLRKEGRPWKPVDQNATWHRSRDLESVSKKKLTETFGENPQGHAHHHVDLETAGGAISVQRDDCVRICTQSSEGGDSAELLVCVDAVLSVIQSAKRVFWLKGWRLLRAEETILKGPERPSGWSGPEEALWPAEERYLGMHTLGLWKADSVVGKVQVRWGVQAPRPAVEGNGGKLLSSGRMEGQQGSAACALMAPAGTDIYCPMKYCGETHDFVALERIPEPPRQIRAHEEQPQNIELAGQLKMTLAQAPGTSEVQSPSLDLLPSCSSIKPVGSDSRSSPPPPSPTAAAAEYCEPLRLTYGSWPDKSPEGPCRPLAPQISPSPIVLINASVAPKERRLPVLQSPTFQAQPTNLQLTPSISRPSTDLTSVQETPPPVCSSTSLQLPAPPPQKTPPPRPAVPEPSSSPLESKHSARQPLRTSKPPESTLRLQLSSLRRKAGGCILRNVDLCCGMGRFPCGCSYASLGERWKGEIATIAAVDINKDALSTCQRNVPGCRFYHETMAAFADRIARNPTLWAAIIDMLTVGLPCQSFSGANPRNNDTSLRRNSIDGGEGPSELPSELPAGRMLFEDFLRIVELVQPRYIVLEEVIEILTLVDPRLHEPVGIALTRALVRLGYQTRWQVLLAAHFGAPQNRYRAYLCAARIGESLPQVAVPTHCSTSRRPSKSLGRFEKCLLQLSKDPDGAKLDDGPKRKEGNKGRKKKPRMALRIELRPKVGGSSGEATAMHVGLAPGPTEAPESGVEAERGTSPLSADAGTSQQRRAELAAADPVAVCIGDLREAELVETTGRGRITAEVLGEGTASLSEAAEENGAGRGAKAGSGDVRPGAPSPVGLASGRGGARLEDQGVLMPARQPSGALKREREDSQVSAPHPAAFFRTRERYAVVNKRGPDLAGREGDRRRTDCSCCLQRERASGTRDLLPAVTVHQAIGHLPKLARSAEMKLADGTVLYNHIVQDVKPG